MSAADATLPISKKGLASIGSPIFEAWKSDRRRSGEYISGFRGLLEGSSKSGTVTSPTLAPASPGWASPLGPLLRRPSPTSSAATPGHASPPASPPNAAGTTAAARLKAADQQQDENNRVAALLGAVGSGSSGASEGGDGEASSGSDGAEACSALDGSGSDVASNDSFWDAEEEGTGGEDGLEGDQEAEQAHEYLRDRLTRELNNAISAAAAEAEQGYVEEGEETLLPFSAAQAELPEGEPLFSLPAVDQEMASLSAEHAAPAGRAVPAGLLASSCSSGLFSLTPHSSCASLNSFASKGSGGQSTTAAAAAALTAAALAAALARVEEEARACAAAAAQREADEAAREAAFLAGALAEQAFQLALQAEEEREAILAARALAAAAFPAACSAVQEAAPAAVASGAAAEAAAPLDSEAGGVAPIVTPTRSPSRGRTPAASARRASKRLLDAAVAGAGAPPQRRQRSLLALVFPCFGEPQCKE